MVEYIAEIMLDTEGDWGYSQDLREHLGQFSPDPDFTGDVSYCDSAEEAADMVSETLRSAAVSGGIFRPDMGMFELDFQRRLAQMADALELDGMPLISWLDSDECPADGGGFRVGSESGNWMAIGAVYIAVDGEIGDVEEYWIV